MVSIIISSLILLLIASTYAVLLKRKLAETIFLAVVSVISILYCFSFFNTFGSLLWGIYLLVAIAIICLRYLLLKNKEILKDAELLQGILIYAILLFFAYSLTRGRVFHAWDEFSHWGSAVKYLFHTDTMWTYITGNQVYDNFIVVPNYFPGTALFQYFFLRFNSEFIEYIAYIASNMLFFSLLMPFIKDIFGNNFNKISVKPLILLLVFIALPAHPHTFGFFIALYVDGILGVMFGFAVIYYLVYDYGKSRYGTLMVTSSVLMLPFIKHIGLLLAFGVIGIIVLDMFLFRRKQMFSFIFETGKSNIEQIIGKMFFICLPLIATLFLFFSWSFLNSARDSSDILHATSSFEVIRLLLTGQLEGWRASLADTYFSNVITNRNVILSPFKGEGIPFTQFLLFYTLVFMSLVLINLGRINIKRTILTGIVVFVGAWLWQVATLVFYLSLMEEWDASRFPSYERYTFTYILAMLYILCTFYIDWESDTKPPNFIAAFKTFTYSKYIIVTAQTIALLFLLANVYAYSRAGLPTVLASRNLPLNSASPVRGTKPIAESLMPYLNNSKIFLILPNDNGGTFFSLRYDLFPYALIPWPHTGRYGYWNIVPPQTESNLNWIWRVSADEWRQYLYDNDFDFVYVHNLHDIQIETYGHLFVDGMSQFTLYYIRFDDYEEKIFHPLHTLQ